MILNAITQKIHKIFLASVLMMVFMAACAPAEIAIPEATRMEIVTMDQRTDPTTIATIIPTAELVSTMTREIVLEAAQEETTDETQEAGKNEHEITNALDINLRELASAPGVTGEIAKTYPEIQNVMENNFPITIEGEVGGGFTALVTDFIVYTDYETAPRLFDNVVIIEVELSYLDANQQEQQIYVPFKMYNEKTQMLFEMATVPRSESKDYLIEYMPRFADDTHMDGYRTLFGAFLVTTSERGEKQIVFNKNNTGFFVNLDSIYPIASYNQNLTSGWDFDLLDSDNPPYIEDDLKQFQTTGDPQYLVELDGKRYFWPITNLSGSIFNLFQDWVQ